VPPHQLLIYDSSGVQVKSIAGPFQVGVEFGLSCEVRGGNSTPSMSTRPFGWSLDRFAHGEAGSHLKIRDQLSQHVAASASVYVGNYSATGNKATRDPATSALVNATVLSMIYNAFHK